MNKNKISSVNFEWDMKAIQNFAINGCIKSCLSCRVNSTQKQIIKNQITINKTNSPGKNDKINPP